MQNAYFILKNIFILDAYMKIPAEFDSSDQKFFTICKYKYQKGKYFSM